jgi:DNA-binding MarR family transcriptional regulator
MLCQFYVVSVTMARTAYETMKQRIVDITHSQYSIQILDALFDHPIFQTTDLATRTNIPKQTLMPLIRQIKDSGYLKVEKEASGRRAATLAFSELLNIAEGRKIL